MTSNDQLSLSLAVEEREAFARKAPKTQHECRQVSSINICKSHEPPSWCLTEGLLLLENRRSSAQQIFLDLAQTERVSTTRRDQNLMIQEMHFLRLGWSQLFIRIKVKSV